MTAPLTVATTGSRRRLAALLAIVATALGIALWSAGGVSAHAELLGVTPADGAVVQDTPAAVVLQFSEAVSLAGGSARILDGSATVVSGDPVVDGATVTIPLGGEHPDGTYTVTWVAISEDSHPVSGATTFSIGAPSNGGAAVATPGAPSAGWGVRLAAWLLVAVAYVGALLAAGAWAFLVFVAPAGAADERGSGWRGRVRAVAVRGAVLGAVAALVAMPLKIARLGGGLGALRDNDLLGASLRGPIGISTGVTAAALLVLAGLMEPAGSDRRRPSAIAGLVVALAALVGFTIEGHTRSQHPVALMIAFDVVHLAAGAVWLGGIAALVIAFRSGEEEGRLGPVVRRFSTLAVGAVAAVVAAGTGMAILVLPTVADLFTTGYGQTLLVKVALVAVIVGLGAYNNRRLVPAMPAGAATLEKPMTRRRLGTIVSIELVGLVAVVGVTSLLVNRSPVEASTAPSTAAPVTVPTPDSVEVPLTSGAGTVTYLVSPGTAGQNQMELTLTDADGQPLQPIDVPTVELTEPQLGVGPLRPIVHPIQPGQFHVIADIPLAGTYDMVIRVRISDFVAVQATSQVTIGE
jgi:copper transport protein